MGFLLFRPKRTQARFLFIPTWPLVAPLLSIFRVYRIMYPCWTHRYYLKGIRGGNQRPLTTPSQEMFEGGEKIACVHAWVHARITHHASPTSYC